MHSVWACWCKRYTWEYTFIKPGTSSKTCDKQRKVKSCPCSESSNIEFTIRSCSALIYFYAAQDETWYG